MKRRVIQRQAVARTIGEALLELADNQASGSAIEKLSTVLRVDEAIAVAKLVIEERIECVRCERPTPARLANETMCCGCFVAVKRERALTAQ